MAGSSWGAFIKAVLIPMLIAFGIYVSIFLVLLPLYRRHRSQIARYSSYTPLSSSLAQRTTSLFEPYLVEPSKTVVQKLREGLVKIIRWALLPRSSAMSGVLVGGLSRAQSGGAHSGEDEDDDSEHGGLFDEESGEAMIGFDFQQPRGLRGAPRRDVIDAAEEDLDDSNRRLSRELEEGFRDDSGSEASDEEVTAGRRTVSRRGSEAWR